MDRQIDIYILYMYIYIYIHVYREREGRGREREMSIYCESGMCISVRLVASMSISSNVLRVMYCV